jgi:hypothetical protein
MLMETPMIGRGMTTGKQKRTIKALTLPRPDHLKKFTTI